MSNKTCSRGKEDQANDQNKRYLLTQQNRKEKTRKCKATTDGIKRTVTICLTNCRYEVIKEVAKDLGYKLCSETKPWNFCWNDTCITLEKCKELKRFQRINHFPGMYEICRKDLLARHLNRMQKSFPNDYNFFPKTWCIPSDLSDLYAHTKEHKNKTYILKPECGSQGKGICIVRTIKDITPLDRMVCQVYITKPFLIDGYKFDLRIYTLITSCEPLRLYVYKEGLVRFATSRYKEPTRFNISNYFMHLTNYAVNKHSASYIEEGEEGSKRKLTWFNEYLRDSGHDVAKLWKRIDDIIIKTVISGWPILKHQYLSCFSNHDVVPACVELLGTDILLDRHLNPKILELNHFPSLQTSTPIDVEVKEKMIEDILLMLNLEYCDKKKIIREDKKKVRDRLFYPLPAKAEASNGPQTKFSNYYKYEVAHSGGFRLIYPLNKTKHNYNRFFDQSASAPIPKSRRESPLSYPMKKPSDTSKDKIKEQNNFVPSGDCTVLVDIKREPIIKTVPVTKSSQLCSFTPGIIIEADEKDRLKQFSHRNFLIKKYNLTERIYFALKKSGALQASDEKKYSFFNTYTND